MNSPARQSISNWDDRVLKLVLASTGPKLTPAQAISLLTDAGVYHKANCVDKHILEKYRHAVDTFGTLDASSPLVADYVERLVVSNLDFRHRS